MRLVFLGSDIIALPSLNYLRSAAGVELAGVISQPDKPSGRGRHLHANPVAAWAKANCIPLVQPVKPGVAEVAWMREQGVDLALVMAYGHILRDEFLAAPPRGAWNLHASLLPAYRGASPIEAALSNGENETGICLMRIVAALDAGPVAGIERVTIQPEDTSPVLSERMGRACVPLLARHLAALADGSIQTTPQDAGQATFTRKLSKADAQLDFAVSAVELERRVRAFQPWPGAAIEHNRQTLKVGAAAALVHEQSAAPGTVLRAGNEGLDVATGGGMLRLLALQRPGARMLPAAEFLRGCRIAPGEVLPSHATIPLVAPRPFSKAK